MEETVTHGSTEAEALIEKKKAEIKLLLSEHGVWSGNKKVRQLLELDDKALGTYKLNLQIGKCCQVCCLYVLLLCRLCGFAHHCPFLHNVYVYIYIGYRCSACSPALHYC